MKNPQEYYIGLNISETAVGWAVTDPEYHLLKANQKNLWGVRLFDRADSADERRAFRYARRKQARRNQRIQLLQMLFREEIAKVDPAFFQRLRESKFASPDKNGVSGPFALFDDPGYTDRDFYRNYPTIYHLRKALLTEDHPFDIRLVYLAFHHILKHRGHFLNDNSAVVGMPSFDTALENINTCLEEQERPLLVPKDAHSFEETLRDISLGKATRKKLLLKAAGIVSKNDAQYPIISLLAGTKVDLRTLFPSLPLKAISISLEDLQDESTAEQVFALLDPHDILLRQIKALSDWAAVANLLNGEPYLSFAKVNCYEKHKADLSLLKNEIKQSLPEKYYEIFHLQEEKLFNYAAYCGHKHPTGHCTYSQFKTYLRNIIKTIPSPSNNTAYILQELDQNTFLPIQTGLHNGMLPNSLHRQELIDILRRAETYLPFLRNHDEYGQTVSDKILSIFDFKIPYFVGPLNPQSPYAWIVRTAKPIRPWNFEQAVDLTATAERFMALRTASCPYLGCDVLPKDSLLYSEFTVLQALNRLRISGVPLSSEQKQQVLHHFFMKNKQVSREKFVQYLMDSGICPSEETISGLDREVKYSLRSQIIYSSLLSRTQNHEMVEDLIRHTVLFGRDKLSLRRYVQQAYGNTLTDKEITFVCRQNFSGWGNLSKEFLTAIYHTDPTTGEAFSILEMMRRTTCTLSELLSEAYTFHQSVQEYLEQHNDSQNLLDDLFEQSHATPIAKRVSLQAIALVDEIIKIRHKQMPARVFITTSNSGSQRQQAVFVKSQLLNRYNACGVPAAALLPNLTEEKASQLYDIKKYLYYSQLGKCMYSGEEIDPNLLDDNAAYCVVPLYPSHQAIDDTLDNLVLVCKNMQNSNMQYPLSAAIRKQQFPFWRTLYEANLISASKYTRLLRSTPFSESELADFISEQISPISHLSKLTKQALTWKYGKQSKICFINMRILQQLRQQAGNLLGSKAASDFTPFRFINDLHFAKDAYLSIAAGNAYVSKFTFKPLQWMRRNETYRLDSLYDATIPNAWLPDANGSISTIWHTIRKNNVLFTRKAYQAHGGLFDQTLLPKGKGQTPVKSSDPRMTIEKFGGYNKLKGTYFCYVTHQRDGKRICSLEAVYLMHERLYRADPIRYCKQVLELDDPQILIPCVKMDALFSYDGFRMHISGRSSGGKQIVYKNANPLILGIAKYQYIKNLLAYLEHAPKTSEETELIDHYQITESDNIALYETFEQKLLDFYGHMYIAAQKAVVHGKKKFTTLGLPAQCTVLGEMLKMFVCRPTTTNLSAIGGSRNGGRLLLTNAFSPEQPHQIYLICQSITGVFEQKIDLLKMADDAAKIIEL